MNINKKTRENISDLENILHIINYNQIYMDESCNLNGVKPDLNCAL